MPVHGNTRVASEGICPFRQSCRHGDTTLAERNRAPPNPLSALFVAATSLESMVLQLRRYAGATVRELRDGLEHVRYARPLSRLQSSMALDDLFALLRGVVARGLVRAAALISGAPPSGV